MFEVKWFLFKSEKEMNADKILPIDLYHAVSIANLTLESALKVIHVEAGQDHELLPLEPGNSCCDLPGRSSNAKHLETVNLHSCRTGVPGVCGRCE